MAHTHGGAKLGTKVAHVVSRSIVATHNKLVGVKHRLAMLIFHDISDMISREVHYSLDPVMTKLHAALPDGSSAKSAVEFMANQTGQAQALSGTSMLAGSLMSSVAQVINNELADAVYGLLESNPHLLPDPATLAQMAAKGIVDEGNAAQHIAMQGINTSWIQPLIESLRSYPDPVTALEFIRRGLMTGAEFDQWGARNGFTQDAIDKFKQLQYAPLSPADAALAVLRGNIPKDVAYAIARENGIESGDFDTLVNNTGEPLGLMQLLEAYRRGFIDEATVKKGILDSRVRNEWIPTALQLRYSPMTVSDAVNATVQNQMAQADAEKIADENGLQPGAFQTLLNTAGEPLSRTEMENLYNRGLATKSQVEQALRESRLKNKYNSLAFELHTRLLDTGQIADAVLYGTMTHAQAVEKAMLHGFSPDDAATIAQSAVNRKLELERKQVVTAIVAMYEANAISLSDATSLAGNLGFEASESAFIFQSAEFRRNEKLVSAAMSAVRSKYIGHHITENEAQAYVDALGIPASQRDQVIQLWTIERDANVRTLTPAQIVKAANLGLISADDAVTRLTNEGYNVTDANLLLGGA